MTDVPSSPRLGVLIIGDELLSGRRVDKHMQQSITLLAERGLELSWCRYLGDDMDLLAAAFRDIGQAGDICFSFGGIGATPDDRTRQAMAMAHQLALFRHPDAVAEIEQRYGEGAYPKRILMAELPQGAAIIPNPFNRIPGFSLGHIHCLPGFPEMAWPMMQWVLDTLYPTLHMEKPLQLCLLLEGIRESELIDPMRQLQDAHPGVKISSLPRFLAGGGYQVEMGVRGAAKPARQAFAELQGLLDALHIGYRRMPSDIGQ
jgi:molybdopterin-biosynthesis enzyme MoeA-like protein